MFRYFVPRFAVAPLGYSTEDGTQEVEPVLSETTVYCYLRLIIGEKTRLDELISRITFQRVCRC